MKAHSNYTTSATTAAWLWRGAAALLTLAALIVALIGVPRSSEQVLLPNPATFSIARHASDPIASCRACRDEWATARAVQPAVAASAGSATSRPRSASTLAVSRANAPIGSCRACRDEWVAAQAPMIPSTSGLTFVQPEDDARTPGPRW